MSGTGTNGANGAAGPGGAAGANGANLVDTVASLTLVIQDFARRAREEDDDELQGAMPGEYDSICERIDALEDTGVDVTSLRTLMEPVHAMFPRNALNQDGGKRKRKSKSKKSKKSKSKKSKSKKSKSKSRK